MKRILLVLLLATLVACPKPHPPVPQPPAPVPAPQPTPEPQPPVERPKPRNSDRVILLGAYGAFNSTQSDFRKMAADIYGSKYTGMSVFLLAPGTQVKGAERWPWMIAGGKAQLNQRNGSYYDAFRAFVRVNLWYHNDFEICFRDRYFAEIQKEKFHPFRSNSAGIYYGDTAKWIFDGILFPGPKWGPYRWDIISESSNKFTFYVNNALGKALEDSTNELLKILADELKADPDSRSRIFLRPHNEERAYIGSNGKADSNKSIGDRSEMIAWFYEHILAAGLKPDNKRIYFVVNRNVNGAATETQLCDAMRRIHGAITREYGKNFGFGALHEIHGASKQQRDYLTSKCGVDSSKTLWSTDGFGVSIKDRANFVKGQRDALARGDKFNDAIFEEGGAPGQTSMWGGKVAPYEQYKKNWDSFFSAHSEMIK